MAEDCLYLNVTAPAGPQHGAGAGRGRPVLLWIHGGGFEMGHGPDQAGDGAAFARSHGLVVVTFNYRLGALGFLDVPGEQPTGALGLHDQVAALRWTRDNIAAFGGDPGQITVYGLSAGGKSVTNLLASPLTKGLIRRAAESSGGDHVKRPGRRRARIAGRFFGALGTTAASGSGPCPRRTSSPRSSPSRSRRGSTWIWRPSVDGDRADQPTRWRRSRAARRPGCRCCCRPAPARPPCTSCSTRDGADAGGAGAHRVLRRRSGRRRCSPPTPRAYPELDETALRGVTIMTDERYVVRTERLADAQAAHAPVWRSSYDGPYTGMEDDPDPEFARYAGAAARRARRRRRRASGRAATARPRTCTTPGARSRRPATPAGRGTSGRAAGRWPDGDDLRRGRPAPGQRPVRVRPARPGPGWTGSRAPGGRWTASADRPPGVTGTGPG